MHRFFVEPSAVSGNDVLLSERESHHGLNVVRLRAGERVVALDGAGNEYSCEVADLGKRQIRLHIQQRHFSKRLGYELVLLQAVTKGKTMDLIIQKATELGVSRIVPLLAERSVSQVEPEESDSKVEKWEQTAIESIKQCGSAWLPKIDPPVRFNDYLARNERFELSLLATLQPDAQHPSLHLRSFVAEKKRNPKLVAVWIGPEGDFTPAETNAIRNQGALPITLGQLVLRSETAAIYCLSVLNYELQAPQA